MYSTRKAQSTLLFCLMVALFVFPHQGKAQASVFPTGDMFMSDLLEWNDPVSPSPLASKVSMRSATIAKSEVATFLINGVIFNSTDNLFLSGAKVFCYNNDSIVVSSTETDSNGSYRFNIPKGKYTISVSKLGYETDFKKIVILGGQTLQFDFYLQPIITSASYSQVLTGLLAEGSMRDITLENSKIAMSIAVESQDQQLGIATKGKPIDLSTTDGVDGFDWINLPLISTRKLNGTSGTLGSMSQNVQFNTVKILSSTQVSSKVVAEGGCTDLPLKVKNIYVVKPDNQWFDVTTTIKNVGDSTVHFWLGDAMDNDELGQTSVYPNRQFSTSIILSSEEGLSEYIPAEPWMGCFGRSDQVFGIFYKGDYAQGFTICANTYRTVSQKYITLEPGGIYYFSRQIAAVPVKSEQSHSIALRSCYQSVDEDHWGLGTVLRVNKSRVNPGDTIQCSLTITNLSKTSVFEDVAGVLTLPPFWKGNADTLFFGDLMPLRSVEAEWEIVPTEGSGNTPLTAQAFAWSEPFSTSQNSVFVDGEGWYGGDNHMHSIYSDGWGTIPEIKKMAKLIGLSFITCTDHNTTTQDSALKAICTPDFLAMTGCEVTPNYKAPNNWGHAVSLFSNVTPTFSNVPSQSNAQAIVDNINALNDGNGFAIMAHPFLKGCPWIYTNVTGFKGIEVWSCFTPYTGIYSKLAFALWDKKNNAGIKQYGFAESDAHNLDMVGKPHIVAHLKDFSQEEISNALHLGQFYGTDGPALRFTVDSVMMGGTLPVTTKRIVKISMKANSPQGIDSMYLFRNGILVSGFSYAELKQNVQEVVYDEAVPGDFYRMECTDRWCHFAFSNPVFIVPAEQDYPQVVDTLSTVSIVKGLQAKIGVYPNPASDFIHLKIAQPTKSAVSILDLNGRTWLNETLNNETDKLIDVRSLPKGVYVIRINERRLKLILK